jgi:hypothetical protein
MRKFFLVSLIIALFAVIPASAQDDSAVVACSEEEVQLASDAVVEVAGLLQTVADGIGDGSDPAAITQGVIDYATLSTGFWNEVYPLLPACEDSIVISYNFGLVLDEAVISTGIARLALFEAEYGDAEIATSYADYAQARAEWYAEEVGATFGEMAETGEIPEDMGFFGLPACTEADFADDSMTALTTSLNEFQNLSAVTDVGPDELTGMIGVVAGLSANYWVDVFPAMPECNEIFNTGYNVGLLYDETLITILLSRLSIYEADNGDVDVATALSDAAAARQALMEAWVAVAFPSE